MFLAPISLPELYRRFERIVAGFLLISAALCIWALSTPPAYAAEVEISSGTLTSNANAGTKWISVDFDALSTGDHELTVTWGNANADLQINVFDDQTGNSIGNFAYTTGEVVWTGALDVNGDYRVSIWVGSGGATYYEANLSDDVGPPDPGTGVVIGTGILDSDKALGPSWVRIDFDALATTMHTITVSWDTPAADVRFRVRKANGTPVSPVIKDANPGVWQGQLVQGESYYIGLWSDSGSTNYTATLDVLPDTGNTVVIGTGILDSDKVLGPRWVRIDFDALGTTMHTITVSWDTPAADLRFRVRKANGTAISPIIKDANPGVWQGQLVQGESYYIALWSDSGSTNYTATLDASVGLAITTQPSDQSVTEGDDAVFTVVAAGGGSGTVNYQWYADNSVIGGATTDTLTVSAVTLGDTGTIYSVVVTDNTDTVISNDAMLTVVPATSNVVAHWKMNEPSGASVMNDASGNGHHGTIGLDVVTGDADMGATSYRWLFTPPTANYEPERIINAPHDSDFNPGSGNYSITMTYRTSVPFGNIMQKGQGGATGGYWKIENPAGYLTCVFRGVAPSGGWNRKEVVSSVPLNDGQYHTIICERIGTQLRLTVDGVLDDTANNSTGSISNNQPMSIGGKTNCDNVGTSCDYFTGWIDDIMISIPD